MSGVIAALAGVGLRPINPIPITDLTDLQADPLDASAAVTFATDGTFGFTGDFTTVGPNWFDPTTTGVGSSYWVRCTVTAGTGPTSGTTGSWLQLSSSRSWQWDRTTVGTTTATVTWEIATDAAGANIIASVTGVAVSVQVVTQT